MAPSRSAADSWNAFQLRYISYRKRPTWNHWKHPPNSRGVVSRRDATLLRAKGARAGERLRHAIHRLKLHPRFPHRPSQFGQREINWIVREHVMPKPALVTFWEALIFDRDIYTCQYCRRSARSMWQESHHRRSLGLVVDHRQPRSQQGLSYALKNGLTACWTCNGIKASLPADAFREELTSLARAVLGKPR